MSVLEKKLGEELLRADIDISLVSTTTETNLILRITEKPKLLRMLLALLFGVPCLLLLRTALVTPFGSPYLIHLIALVCVPTMGLLAVLIGFCVFEKTFNRAQRQAINSVGLFRMKIEEFRPLPEKGLVRLTSHWDLDPPCWRYRVTVLDSPGYSFVISREYRRALDFGRLVSDFLSFEFKDESEEKSRMVRG